MTLQEYPDFETNASCIEAQKINSNNEDFRLGCRTFIAEEMIMRIKNQLLQRSIVTSSKRCYQSVLCVYSWRGRCYDSTR